MYQFAKKALHVIRWVLILPAAIASWYVASSTCLALWLGMQEVFFSDVQCTESGSCVAPWAGPGLALMALVAFGSALAAALVMITCALLAPTHKREVGTSVSLGILGAAAGFWGPLLYGWFYNSLVGYVKGPVFERGPSVSCPGEGTCYSDWSIGPGPEAAIDFLIAWGHLASLLAVLVALIAFWRSSWKLLPSAILGWSLGTVVLREFCAWYWTG